MFIATRVIPFSIYLHFITKHTYKIWSLKPHLYIVKLGFTGEYIIFFLFLKNIDCRYSFEPSHRGGSNEYPYSMFWAEIWKISEFLSENFQFLAVIFSIYLNRRVFVMNRSEDEKWLAKNGRECSAKLNSARDTLVDCSPIFTKETFCDFPIAYCIPTPLWKGVYSKRKILDPYVSY